MASHKIEIALKCECGHCGHKFELTGEAAKLKYDYSGCYYEGDIPELKLRTKPHCPSCWKIIDFYLGGIY